MADAPQRRLASNEAGFREVDEGIERGQWPGEEAPPIGFRSSARGWDATCCELTLAEYAVLTAAQGKAHPHLGAAGRPRHDRELVTDLGDQSEAESEP